MRVRVVGHPGLITQHNLLFIRQACMLVGLSYAAKQEQACRKSPTESTPEAFTCIGTPCKWPSFAMRADAIEGFRSGLHGRLPASLLLHSSAQQNTLPMLL